MQGTYDKNTNYNITISIKIIEKNHVYKIYDTQQQQQQQNEIAQMSLKPTYTMTNFDLASNYLAKLKAVHWCLRNDFDQP